MRKNRIAGIIGNFLDQYDHTLFGILAPFIAPLFFEKNDPLTALILTYGMIPLGLLSRPLGSLFFGALGDRKGRRAALSVSLCGMAFATTLIGFLPLYSEVGIFAPIGLAAVRLLQGFFAAGETVGGSIFVLEHTPAEKRGFFSGLYDASSIAGMLLGSALVTALAMRGWVESSWRLLFWGSALLALVGIYLRFKSQESVEYSEGKHLTWKELLAEKQSFFSLVLAAGFSYTTYSLSFLLMNGLVPLVTEYTKADVMKINTALLALDMVLLPLFGSLGKKSMLYGASFAAVAAVPLFTLLEGASLPLIIFIRTALVLAGVAFAGPYHAWALEQIAPRGRYRILSLSYSIGSQAIGATAPAICLFLFQITGSCASSGLYLFIVAALAMTAVALPKRVFRKSF